MKVDVLLGLQWGDEGKGKVVDVLTPRYDVVARFQGGPNAGHTLEFEGQKYVLRSIPSGIFQGNKVNIIGNGVVLDPALFKAEAEALEASGHPLKERLHISKKAHLILPTHRILDAAYEAAKGDAKVGTTGKGIGPTSNTSYEETEKVTYPAYTMWKLTLSQKVWKGVDMTLAVDNLFNYVPFRYYNNSPATKGTTFSAGLSLDIEQLFK